jgi:carbon-monoxide dehydrogenase medium subunit
VSGSGGAIDPGRVRALLDESIEPEDDIHATAAYRRHLAHVLTERAVRQAHDDALDRRQGRAA